MSGRVQGTCQVEQLPSERELMDEYGVGRPAVREALQALERSGIVEIAHGERARVVVPTAQGLVEQIATGAMHLLRTQPGSLEHLKEAHVFLETGMARLAAARASVADVQKLRETIAQQRASIADVEVFLQRDMDFHRQIAAISGNPIFPVIVEAIAANDPEAAAAAMNAHLTRANTLYRSLIRE